MWREKYEHCPQPKKNCLQIVCTYIEFIHYKYTHSFSKWSRHSIIYIYIYKYMYRIHILEDYESKIHWWGGLASSKWVQAIIVWGTGTMHGHIWFIYSYVLATRGLYMNHICEHMDHIGQCQHGFGLVGYKAMPDYNNMTFFLWIFSLFDDNMFNKWLCCWWNILHTIWLRVIT